MKVNKKKSKELTMVDDFNILLYCIWADCGNKKEFAKFKAALETASDILNEGK